MTIRKKQTLVATVGSSPQVVTETLYAIHKDNLSWPDELIIITTSYGREKVLNGLFTKLKDDPQERNHLEKCCDDLNRPRIAYNINENEKNDSVLSEDKKIKDSLDQDQKYIFKTIWVIPDHNGLPIDDARTKEDQEALANYIVKTIAQLCATCHDSPRSVHASLAGGRKTMTFFLGYAMSLFAKNDDILSHVLISPSKYENHPDFYYPTPYRNKIEPIKKGNQKNDENDGVETHEDEVTVMLSNIPFIRHREQIGGEVLNGFAMEQFNLDYKTLVKLQNIAQTITTQLISNKENIDKHQKKLNNKKKAHLQKDLLDIDSIIKSTNSLLNELMLDFNLKDKYVDVIYCGENLTRLNFDKQELSLAFYSMVARHDKINSNYHYCRSIANIINKTNQKKERMEFAFNYLSDFAALYLYELEQIVYPEQNCEPMDDSRKRWDKRATDEEKENDDELSQYNLRGYQRTYEALGKEVKTDFFDQRKSELREVLLSQLPKELAQLIEPDFTYIYKTNKAFGDYITSFKQNPTMPSNVSHKQTQRALGLKVNSNYTQVSK